MRFLFRLASNKVGQGMAEARGVEKLGAPLSSSGGVPGISSFPCGPISQKTYLGGSSFHQATLALGRGHPFSLGVGSGFLLFLFSGLPHCLVFGVSAPSLCL